MKRALILTGRLFVSLIISFAVSAAVDFVFGYDWSTVIQNTIILTIINSVVIVYHYLKRTNVPDEKRKHIWILFGKLFGMLLVCFAVNVFIDLFLKDGWQTVIKDTVVQAIVFWAVIIYQHLKKRG